MPEVFEFIQWHWSRVYTTRCLLYGWLPTHSWSHHHHFVYWHYEVGNVKKKLLTFLHSCPNILLSLSWWYQTRLYWYYFPSCALCMATWFNMVWWSINWFVLIMVAICYRKDLLFLQESCFPHHTGKLMSMTELLFLPLLDLKHEETVAFVPTFSFKRRINGL